MPKVVLFVDDEPLILDLTSSMLEDLGCEVLSAETSAEVLVRLAEDPRIGLVMTEVEMPGMAEYVLAAKVRERWPDLRIVVMSANDLSNKGYAVVRKPFSRPQLERIIAPQA